MVHRKKNGIKMVALLLFSLLNLCAFSTSCLGANLTLNEFREICDIPDSVTIPNNVQNAVTTQNPVIIKSQDNNYIYIYPTTPVISTLNGYNYNVDWKGNFAFFTSGTGSNTYFYFFPNVNVSKNPSAQYIQSCYMYDVTNKTFTTPTWFYIRPGYGSLNEVGARFGLKIDISSQTETDFKSLSNLKSFLSNNLLFTGVNSLIYGENDVLYRFNGVYAGDDVYTSKFTTNLDNFKFNYEAYSSSESYSVVNYFYLQKFAPNEAIQLTDQDIAYWSADNWFYNRDKTTDFSFSTLIDKMETGYIYRLRAFSNQHNASGDLVRTSDATSQFFSLNSWKSSEIEVLNIYELLFTDNPSIEDTGGGPSSGGSDGVIDITGIENQIGNLNTSINDLNNNLTNVPDISGTVISSGDINSSLGFEFMEDPYANFWLQLTTGIGNALTNDIRTLDINWLGYVYTINLDNIGLKYPPAMESILTSVSTVAIVWVLVKWWKIIVDKLSSGNIDEVLAMNEESGIVDLF